MLSYIIVGIVVIISLFLYASHYLSQDEVYVIILTLIIAEVILLCLAIRSRDSIVGWFLVLTPVTVLILYSTSFRVSSLILKTKTDTILQLLQRLHNHVYNMISTIRKSSNN